MKTDPTILYALVALVALYTTMGIVVSVQVFAALTRHHLPGDNLTIEYVVTGIVFAIWPLGFIYAALYLVGRTVVAIMPRFKERDESKSVDVPARRILFGPPPRPRI